MVLVLVFSGWDGTAFVTGVKVGFLLLLASLVLSFGCGVLVLYANHETRIPRRARGHRDDLFPPEGCSMETPEYIEGPEARENFERGMIALFKVPKPQPDLGVIPFSRRPVNDFYRYLNCTALLSVNLPRLLNDFYCSFGKLVALGNG